MLPDDKFQTCVNFTKSETCYHLHFCHACLNLLMSELAVAQCSYFVKHHEWIPAMYFVAMLECCSLLFFMHLEGYLLLIADRCHICFCLPFPNRASDSGDLYIDFNRNHLIFPATYLVCQVDALFIIFLSGARICIAYHISHIMPCFASCCLRIAP